MPLMKQFCCQLLSFQKKRSIYVETHNSYAIFLVSDCVSRYSFENFAVCRFARFGKNIPIMFISHNFIVNFQNIMFIF